MAIGIFDSGVGGFGALLKLAELPTHHDFIYLADSANLPYGNKRLEDLKSHLAQAMSWMEHRQVENIVIACHSCSGLMNASAVTPFKKIDMLDSVPHLPLPRGNYAVIATQATAQRGALIDSFNRYYPHSRFSIIACPLLVPEIEGSFNRQKIQELLLYYLKDLQSFDAIIYGCTHYPCLDPILQSISQIKSIDLADYLHLNLANVATKQRQNKKNIRAYTTGDPSKFSQSIKNIYQIEIKVEKTVLYEPSHNSYTIDRKLTA